MKTNKLTQSLVSLSFLLGMSSISSMAAEIMDEHATMPASADVINSETSVVSTAPEIYSNENWQTPIVVEFTKLDSSGNGLLLPKEASKGKAFNKKTFAQADADHDGTIDQNEYIFFKTGKMPEVVKPASMIPAAELVPEKAMPEAADMKDAPMSDNSP